MRRDVASSRDFQRRGWSGGEEGLTRQRWVVEASGNGRSREGKRWSTGEVTMAQASRSGSVVA